MLEIINIITTPILILMDTLLTEAQNKKITESFLRHMLGVSEDSITNFFEERPMLHKDICAKMSGLVLKDVAPAKYDEHSFWEEVRPVLGPLYDTVTMRFMTYAAKQGPYMLMVSATPHGNRHLPTARLVYMQQVYDERL
jgi:hypothetical protein